MKLNHMLFVLFAVIADFASKSAMANKHIDIIRGFFSLHYSANTGSVFGFFQGSAFVLSMLGVIVAIVLFLFYRKEENRIKQYAFLFAIAGTIGNTIDRIVFGYVRDFISFSFWYSFNLADAFITIAIALFLLSLFLERRKN